MISRASSPVVFDGAILASGPITGVGRSFLDTLAAYANRTPRSCTLLLPAGAEPPALPGVRVVEGPRGRLARQRLLPGLLRSLRASLLHCPVAAIPYTAPCPVVATVHDLPWMAPQRLRETGCGYWHRLAVRAAVRRASAIVVPSFATAHDLIRYAGAPLGDRLRVVPHGVPGPRRPVSGSSGAGEFLVLADGRPRKNLDRVRAAHAQARRQRPELPDLRIVGPGHGYVSEARKTALLFGARAVLVLSLHEGFGLPVVEAFAHGVPVVCSDIPSLREVAAGAALLADPTDTATIAATLCRVDSDAALRADLRRRGLQRANELSPRASASAWLALHEEIAA